MTPACRWVVNLSRRHKWTRSAPGSRQGDFSPAALAAAQSAAHVHSAEVTSNAGIVQQSAPGGTEPPGSFAAEIRPIFAARCVQCHGPDLQQNNLRLDTMAGVLKGSVNGPIVIPGSGDKGPIIRRPDGPEQAAD